MRSLTIGVILFLIWAALSAWYYASHIYSFDGELETISQNLEQSSAVDDENKLDDAEKPSLPGPYVIHFDFNTANFTPGQGLEDFVGKCKNYLMADQNSCLVITGHTDSKGTEAYNYKLGMSRADNVKEYFMKMGLSDACIQVGSKGETDPVEENSSDEGRAKNRRAVLAINHQK